MPTDPVPDYVQEYLDSLVPPRPAEMAVPRPALISALRHS